MQRRTFGPGDPASNCRRYTRPPRGTVPIRVLTLYQKSTRGRISETRAMCRARADGTWVTVGPVARRHGEPCHENHDKRVVPEWNRPHLSRQVDKGEKGTRGRFSCCRIAGTGELSPCAPDLRVYSLLLRAHEDSSCVQANAAAQKPSPCASVARASRI